MTWINNYFQSLNKFRKFNSLFSLNNIKKIDKIVNSHYMKIYYIIRYINTWRD